jgi:AcrR family transcriptional regulator
VAGSTPTEPSRSRVRPGGRSERVREAVLRACLDLLVEGVVDLPVSEVAERSGVNRGTVYRWWPTTTDLLIDATVFHWDKRLDPPDTGSWEGDVRAVMGRVAALVEEPVERAIIGAVTTGRYPAFTELVNGVWNRSLPDWFEMIDRAVRRGEVRPDVDRDSVVSMMMSPLISRSLFGVSRTSPEQLEHLIDLVCRATAADTKAT